MTTKQIMDQVISVFENSTTVLQYAYCEALKDGRGYTSGRSGFTTDDGDALGVIRQYNQPSMNKFVDRLQNLCDQNSGSTFGLWLSGYPKAWAEAANDPAFCKAQDIVNDQEYYQPAVNLATKYGVLTPLGTLIFYDTCVQHGIGGPDSLTDIANKATGVSEEDYLKSFLAVRRNVLLNPQDPTTKDEWSQSVGRVDALSALMAASNFYLQAPFTINPFGDSFTIGAI